MANVSDRDAEILRGAIQELEKYASPILASIAEIDQLDAEITRAFDQLGITSAQNAPAKKRSSKSSANDQLVRRVKKLHSYIALAASPETGPQLKDMLAQQIVMQRDLLDMLIEAVEKRFGSTQIMTVDIKPSNVVQAYLTPETMISEHERQIKLDHVNETLQERIKVDEATIVANWNDLRNTREQVMQRYVDNLSTVLAQQSANPKQPLPIQKKVHVFSDSAKSSIEPSDQEAKVQAAMQHVLLDIANGAKAIQDMADEAITKVPKSHADKLLSEQKKAYDIAQRATLLSANDAMDNVARLAATVQLGCELARTYGRVESEAKNAKTGNKFQRFKDNATSFIYRIAATISSLIDMVVNVAKHKQQYKAENFTEIERDAAELMQKRPSIDLSNR